MKLQQVIDAAGHRVCGGSEYQWKCYGPNARFLDFSDLDGNEDVVGCVYDTDTQDVYQVEVWVNPDNVVYRWIDPAYVGEYAAEAQSRGVNPANAFDEVNFTEVPADSILGFATSVIHGTYVHSHVPITDEAPVAWPFPLLRPESKSSGCCGGCHGDESECGGDCDEDDGVDAFIESLCKETEEKPTMWDVTLTTKHKLEITASTMEEAYRKAQEFKENVKVHNWGDGVTWMDHYVSKYKIGQRVD